MVKVGNKGKKILSIILNGFLYFIGGILVLGTLIDNTPIKEKIIPILIGISLFNFIYKLIGKKLNISKKKLILIRIVTPFIVIFDCLIFYIIYSLFS